MPKKKAADDAVAVKPTAKYKETPKGNYKSATFRRRVGNAVDLIDWKTGATRTISSDRVRLLKVGSRGGLNYVEASETTWSPS